MMKHKIISILAAAAAVLLAAACGKVHEEFDPNDPAVMTIKAQPDAVSLSAVDGVATVTFTAPDYWFVSSPNNWLSFDPASGKPGEVTLTIKSAQNTGSPREALVTITSKKQRGQFKVSQDAWPYGADVWSVFGTVNGNKDFVMQDQDDKLVWLADELPYFEGEVFKFRMGGSDAVSVGLAGELVELEDGSYQAALTKGGGNISLPGNGFWDVTFDLNYWTMQAVKSHEFPWGLVGTIDGGSWDQDREMEVDGNGLWVVSRIAYHEGEAFKFRLNGNDAFSLGADGAFQEISDKTYECSVKMGGGNLSLPLEGYWDLMLDPAALKLGAVFVDEFPKPDPNPLPSNWKAIWVNDGSHGEASWDGQYRFGLEGKDGNNECVATFPQATWDRIKSETLYVYVSGSNPQIRVTTGWWSANLTDADIQPGNPLLTDNQANTWILEVNVAGSAIEAALDEQHLLFTGSGFTVEGLYLIKEDPLKNCMAVWKNDGSHGEAGWDGTYRFGMEGKDGNNECVATFPEKIWNKIKTETIYATLTGANPQIRVTTGWWSANLTEADIQPGNPLLTDNGDGSWLLEVTVAGSPIEAALDDQHLLFTGSGFTVTALYVPAVKVYFWENDGSHGAAAWDSVYRFGLDGKDGNNECIATFPQEIWDIVKNGTFYMNAQGSDWVQMRITSGWWSTTWTGADITTGSERIVDEGDGTYHIELNFAGDPLLDVLDEQHLLFTGSGFTPLKLYYME